MSKTNWADFTPINEDGAPAPAPATDWSKFEPIKEASAARKLGDLGLSVAKGVVAVPEAAVGLADLVSGGHAGKFLENEGGAVGFRPKQAKEFLTSLQSDDLNSKRQQFQQADGVVDKFGVAVTNPSLIANTVAESIPLMGAGAVPARALLAAAPRVGAIGAGAIGEGLVGAGSSAEQIRQETEDGLLTGKQALLAGGSGAATAAFGAAGGAAARRLGIADVDTALTQGTLNAGTTAANKGLVRRTAEGVLSEGVLEELPQSLSEQALQNIALDKPVTEGLADAGVMGVLSGGVMGGGAAALTRQQQAQGLPDPDAGQPPAQPPAPAAEQPPAPFVNPASLTGNNAAALLGGQGAGLTGAADPLRAVVTPSQAMGIDPNAGAISRVAAEAVDGPASMEMAVRQAERDMAALAAEDNPEAGADARPTFNDPLEAQVAGYVAEMGTASPQMIAAKFGVTIPRATELLAQADPTVDDLFPPPQGAANVSNADAAGALAAGVGGPVGTDAAGGQPDAGLLGLDGGRTGAGAAPAPGPAIQEGNAAPVPGRDSDAALTQPKTKNLKDAIARRKAEKANVQDQPQGTATAAAPSPAEAVQAPQAVGGDGAAQPGAAPAGNAGVEAAGVKSATGFDATGWEKVKRKPLKDGSMPPSEVYRRTEDGGTRTVVLRDGEVTQDGTASIYDTVDLNGDSMQVRVIKNNLTGAVEAFGLDEDGRIYGDPSKLNGMLDIGLTVGQAINRVFSADGAPAATLSKEQKKPPTTTEPTNAPRSPEAAQAVETTPQGREETALLSDSVSARPANIPPEMAAGDAPDLADRWSTMTAEQRQEVARGAGWSTAKGAVNVVGKAIARKSWADQAPSTRKRLADVMKASPTAEVPATPAVAAPVPAAAPAPEPAAQADEFLPEGWTKSINGYTKRPVYRMEQGGGQPFAVVTQTEGMTYEVQIRHGDKQLTTSTQRGALSEVLAGAKAELAKMTQAASVTHQDPGEKPEAATKGVVNDSLKTAAKNEDTKPSEMRKWLLAEIDKELLQAPDRADYDEAVKRMGEKDAISMYTGNGFLGKNAETGFITFDVPGDGKFKVRNSVRGLLEFRKTVNSSLGFKDGGQKPLKPEQNDGVQGGSGGQMAAVTNMIEEGDFEAARDYAEAVGIKLEDVKVPRGERKPQWDQFLKDGTVPPPPNTAPLPEKKTADQLNAEKLEAEEAERRRPKDTGWNMAGTGYAGKRYTGRNITLADGRQVVARIYENAGNYDEVEIKVDGARKFTVRDSFSAQDKADAFIRTLTANASPAADQRTEPKQEKGRMTAIPVPASTVAWMGLDGAKSVQADLQALAERHPEYYDDAQAVRKDIDFVLGKPDGWYIHKDRRVVLFRERVGEGAIPQARVEIEADADTMRVRSVYVGGKRQIAKKMADKRKELSGLGLGGQSPDSLTIAEYLEALGDGSSRPAAPSGAAPEAVESVPSIPEGYKPAGEPFYRDGELTQGYAPFDLGQRVTMKESGGQSGVIDLFTSPDKSGVFDGAMVKFDNGVEQIVKLNKLEAEAKPAPAPEADTPKLTQAEAKELMEWQDLGQKDGIKTHILTFYESKADKDAKRGRMVVATVTKEADSKNWVVEGTDDRLAMLAMAKKKAEDAGMARAVADGFVEAVTPTQDGGRKVGTLPKFPVDAYRLERYYANGAKVKPLPAKAFSPADVQAITDWFKSIGWGVTSGSGANGVNATNDIGMTVDDLPEPYTAAQRKQDEARIASDERAAAKSKEQGDYLTTTDSGKFVASMFGDAMNRFNQTALAKVLSGDEKTFGGLFSNRATDVLAEAGIATEGREVKDVIRDIKALFSQSLEAPKKGLAGVRAKKAAEAEAQRATYFTPGNVVKGYGGHDRVLEYTPVDERGTWSVRVQRVMPKDGKWVDAPNERPRWHSTQPEAKELAAGPVVKAPAAAQESPVPAAQPATVENFGEKLPPARRAMAAKLSETLSDDNIAKLPLSQIWPASENEAIEDTFAAAVAHVMREAIPAKPRTAYKVNSWVNKVKMLRDFAAKILRGAVTKDFFMEEMAKFSALRDLRSKIKLLEQIDREQWKRIGDVSEAPNAVRYEEGKPIPSPSVSVSVDGKNHWLRGSGDVLTHLDAIKAMLGTDAPENKMQFEIRQESRGERKVFINKKGDKEYRRLMEFATVDEARKAIREQYADLVAAWEGVKARDNITERDLRSDTNRERAGKDHRKGRDVTAEEFESKFGFRGGEFGKWVGQGKGAQERQFMLNSAYDALMDLSDLLGIPPKAISLEGSLGIAFGSRGSGWASAHFEPSNLVINLTKTRGAGALAHEWFHALDNYFARKRNGGEVPIRAGSDAQSEYRRNNYITHKTSPMMVRKDGRGSPVTKERLAEWRKSSADSAYLAPENWMEDPNHKKGVRAEVEQAFADLVKTLNDTPMLKRARRLDGVKDAEGYWSRMLEMAARSFENYVQARMMEQGYHNDFLANVKEAPEVGKNVERYPYLLPSEIAPVADAFKALFDTIQTKEDDAGNVVLFSQGLLSPASVGPKPTPDQIQRLVDKVQQVAKNVIPVTVVGNPGQIPGVQVPAGAKPTGALIGGRIYLFADNLKSTGDAYVTLFHELFHLGLQKVIPAEDYAAMLAKFSKNLLVQRFVREWKASPEGVEKASTMPAAAYDALAAEEALAMVSEELAANNGIGTRNMPGLAKSMLSWLSSVADRLGFPPSFSDWMRGLTRTDAEKFVSDMVRAAMGGEKNLGRTRARYGTELAQMTEQTRLSAGAAAQTDTPAFKRLSALLGPSGMTGLMQSLRNKTIVDGLKRNAKVLSDLLEGHPGLSEQGRLIDIPTSVVGHVVKVVDDEQIRRAVVAALPVDVVNLFGEKKLSPYQVLSNEAMLKNVLSVNGSSDVSLAIDKAGAKSLLRSVAIQAAELSGLADRLLESDPTGLTNAGDSVFRTHSGSVTETKAFSKWFGDSKVVDADGKPLVVYHGTRFDFADFDGYEVAGWFSATPDLANERYAFGQSDDAGANVMPVYLSIKNPKVLDGDMDDAGADGSPMFEQINNAEYVAELIQQGYDGVVVNEDGRRTYAAFRPEQIKSAIGNKGQFDPENPDIRFRSTPRELAGMATDQLKMTLTAPGKLSWWHKTVGTMYNLAERHPAFKPVFNAAQSFIDDVSYYATDAADMAPKMLPKLESWKDIAKSPISAEDNKAIEAPVNEGTLLWARDESGRPVKVAELEAQAADMTADQKARRLLRNDKINEGVLKMWQGLPQEQYEKLIESRYQSQMLTPGVVWTDAELKAIWKLNDAQIGLYREVRAAIDKSLDNLAKSDLVRFVGKDGAGIKDAIMEAGSVDEAALMARDYFIGLAEAEPDRAEMLLATANGIMDRADKVTRLKEQGYAPLSRFGKYTVDVVTEEGRQYFGLFESMREANQMAARMRGEFGKDAVSQGTLSDESFKLFQGITPETLELFGNMLGLSDTGDTPQDQAFQAYLKLTKNNRSAMKRLIQRKGILGYSQDVGRVLANFIYSNARQTASALHIGDLTDAINAIPQGQGEVKDVAVKLGEYIKNPQEEAQAFRGLLFAQYLGGNISSAIINALQPFQVSFPYLSQFGGAKQAGAEMLRATREYATGKKNYEPDLAQALKNAEDDGTVSPQEVFQLMAQAKGAGSLRSGDGTVRGELLAKGGNAWAKTAMAWGKVFGVAEQFNRRTTFIAAYRIAKAQKMADPAAFAKKAVQETQFIYSKANKPQWARGAIGATVFTFKVYSISYIELLHRMATQGGPEGKRAALLAVAVLLLMGGAGGLPFMEDGEDIADTIAQVMGYNFSTKQAKQELLEELFGEAAAQFIDKGISGVAGVPIDVSGRFGMGNLIPGTGAFLQRNSNARDVLEVLGPAGDLARRGQESVAAFLKGDLKQSAYALSPRAIYNMAKGGDMLNTGMYRDDKGFKVIEATTGEGVLKAIGFQPNSVAKVQEANYLMQRQKDYYNATAQSIRAKWARGLFEKDDDMVAEARDAIDAWNEKNPDQRMSPNMPAIWRRVREMAKDKDQRIADTAPKAMRQQFREETARVREAL